MEDDDNTPDTRPDSLLPYDAWTEDALRQVMLRALRHAGDQGLPGEHHFYLTFRTDHPRTVIPARLRAQYPEEMTIVLQHQFWDLLGHEPDGLITVGLSFGGVPSTLEIPIDAVTGFADPAVQFGLRFHPTMPEPAAAAPPPEPEPAAAPDAPDTGPQVVSLDAFRRRTPPKD